MAYIITTTTYRCTCGHFPAEHGPNGCAGCDNGGREDICERYTPDQEWPEPTSRAVTTLDEARESVRNMRPGYAPTWFGEHGGTTGPLPDGTTIEVEHWGAARAVNWMVEHGCDPAVEFFIDCYNTDNT